MDTISVEQYLSCQKEKLDIYLNSIEDDQPTLYYDQVPQNEEVAGERILATLKKDVETRCQKYLSNRDNKIQKDVLYLFGKDETKQNNTLRRIYIKINHFEQSRDNASPPSLSTTSKLFTNLFFRETCPLCSGMVEFHQDKLMKYYATYERCASNKISKLSFVTQHKGFWVKVAVTLPCAGCCASKSPTTIRVHTSPQIDDINNHAQLLIERPDEFVKKHIWYWIDEHTQ